jgi:hypothetical protein
MGRVQYGFTATRNSPEYVYEGQRAHGAGPTHIYEIRLVSRLQVVYDRRLVEVGQLGHVVGLVELCRIDFVGVVRVDLSLLVGISS